MNSQGAARLRREGSSAAGASILSNIRTADENASAERRAALNSARLEQLLAQIDEHSLALVPTRSLAKHQPPPKPRFHPYLLAFLVVWVSGSAVGIVYFLSQRPVAPQIGQQPQANTLLQQKRVEAALTNSSKRINELEEQLAALRRQQQEQQQQPPPPAPLPPQPRSSVTIAAPVIVKRQPPPVRLAAVRKPAPPSAPPPRITPIPPPLPLAEEPLPPSTPATPVEQPKQPSNLLATFGVSLNLQPTKSSVPHHSAMGTLDFWLVPRGELARADRVLPIGSNNQGVVIHDIDDGKEYTVTPLGDWKAVSTPDPKPPQP